MNHQEFKDLAAIYSLGALDGEERASLERHLEECVECRSLVVEYRDSATVLARALPPASPSAALRASIQARIAPKPVARVRLWMAAAAAALFAAFVGIVGYQAERLKAIESQLALQRKIEELLRDPQARVVDLKGGDSAPAASGRVLWKGSQLALLAAGLPALPKQKIYELWAIVDNKPIPAGLYSTDAEGRVSGIHTLPQTLAKVDAFALTLEPEGGLPAPSGPMVLIPRGP
jgi:anti-sigma-K factor RskA